MIYSYGGVQTALVAAGTGFRHTPGGAIVGTIPVAKRLLILGYDVTGQYAECDGDYTDPVGTKLSACAWLATAVLTDLQPALLGPIADPTTKAGWLARAFALMGAHDAHVYTQGTPAERAALVATFSPEILHALHMANVTP